MPRYPGPGHVLRHLRLTVDASDDDHSVGTMPNLDDMADAGGALRLGPLAMLTDFTAGLLSARAVRPDWTVTYDLELHLLGETTPGGLVTTHSSVVRSGRNNVISESMVTGDDGSDIARAAITFTRLQRRDDTPRSDNLQWQLDLAEEQEAPRVPLDDFLGFVPDIPAGTVTFGHHAVLHNSLGAIQGGVIAMAVERAGSVRAERELGRPARTVHIHLYYLALGRTGPFQARTRLLRSDAGGVVSRVELVDTGDGDRVLALGTATAVSL